MRKEGRTVVTVLLLICFIIAVFVCVYFIVKLDKKEKELENMQEDLAQIKQELGKTEGKTETKNTTENKESAIDVDELNEKYSKRILGVMGAGSFEGKYLAIFGKEYKTYTSTSRISKNNYTYILTSDSYNDFEKEWQNFMSQSLIEELVGNKFISYSDAIISVDGKVAINEGSWTGIGLKFESQKMKSHENDLYEYEIKYKRPINSLDSGEYEEKTAIVVGRVKNSKYIIEKFETN